jgi:hypothetical protein
LSFPDKTAIHDAINIGFANKTQVEKKFACVHSSKKHKPEARNEDAKVAVTKPKWLATEAPVWPAAFLLSMDC